MERPELNDYKEEIHYPNGQTEDVYNEKKYVNDLNAYIEHLEKQLALFEVVQAEPEKVCECGTKLTEEKDKCNRCTNTEKYHRLANL